MSDFEQAREELSRWQQAVERQRAELLLAREAVRRGRRKDIERVRQLEGEGQTLAARLAEAWQRFEPFTDPKQALRRLQDRFPILLFPLRLETRFKRNAQGQPQLWVRVYPDQCLVETFEPALTEQEIANAQVFWAAIWRAGGIDADEQAAWRDLVASHGAGRAGWIVKQYAPLNPQDKPERDAQSDVLLIIVATEALPAQAAAFWTDVWRAGGDDAAIVAHRAALEASVGAQQAMRIIERFRPYNLGDAPHAPRTRATTAVRVAAARFPAVAELDARRSSWSRAPRVRLLPERLVLTAYRGTAVEVEVTGAPIRAPLVVGPDPNAAADRQLRPDGDGLAIPDDIRWMFDFDKALEVGMAFRIDLTPQQAQAGFDRIVVLGIRAADSAQQGRRHLDELIQSHLYSRTGLELLPQGTPTNNTEKGSTGYDVHGDTDAAFDALFRDRPQFVAQADPLLCADGQWFADLLGIDRALVQRIPHAGGRDQIEARAMQIALWPGTMGYMMRTMLAPVFAERDIDATRAFFTRYVSGRGWIPALRIGAQPYGVLPITAFDRIDWFDPRRLRKSDFFGVGPAYLTHLVQILRRIEKDWEPLLQRISFVGKTGPGVDPHQVLLDVLDLHPSSVEFHPLKADSVGAQFHLLALLSFPVALKFLSQLAPTAGAAPKDIALALLRSFGYEGAEEPQVLKLLFSKRQPPLTGPVIDNPPPSETTPLAACAGPKNYIEWMVDAARTNFDVLQEESGFDPGKQPTALLYLMLRHALQVAFHLTAVREKLRRGTAETSPTLFVEPQYVHVQADAGKTESRYGVLHERLDGDARIADLISRNVALIDAELAEQVDALERLARTPTAALERAFAEHIDCVSYRLDAWKQGVLHWQLERLRADEDDVGTYLGAYGWLEHVVPENKELIPVQLPAEIAARIDKPGDAPLVRDSTNLGLVHAPSLNHATTAAVLRNGYHAHDGRLAVDLSSRRVRLALDILQGMRNGQSLGALLGYRFDRHLHDSNALPLRALLYAIRRRFPLVANRIKTTQDDGKPIEAIAAANVVDGLKLVHHVERSAVKTYPWGIASLPPVTHPSHAAAIDAAVAHIRDVADAVADLVLAEGVHQAVLGNYERSAGTLDAFAKGGYPPEFDVVRTPRSGTALTLRTAIHLDPDAPANPWPAIAPTPFALAEPGLNVWLARRLPDPARVGCRVSFVRRTTGAADTVFVRQLDLGLQPIDLVYRVQTGVDATLQFLDEQVLHFVCTTQAPRLDAPIRIEYTARVAGRVTFFELQALLRSLYALAVASRPLQPADLARATDARAAEQLPAQVDASRLAPVRAQLANVVAPAFDSLAATLAAGPIDAAIDAFATEAARAALFRLPQAGFGFAYEWREQTYRALAVKLQQLVADCEARLADADAKLAEYDAALGLPDEEKRARLAAIELLVSTSYVSPQPPSLADYRNAVGVKRAAFAGEIAALAAIGGTRFATLDAFVQALAARPLANFCFEALDLAAVQAEIERFRARLVAAAGALRDEALRRVAAADGLLAAVPLALEAVQKAAKALLGDDFQIIPHFTLRAESGADFAQAWMQGRSGELTRYLREAIGRAFPEDDWLHGMARVRDKMRHWENAVLLAEAFGTLAPAITPLQLPFEAGAAWHALEVPPPAEPGQRAIARDRLLYSAHFDADFDPAKPIAGLLVDEWTEVIPEAIETTGVAFHYDRPNSEPPQTWLLALPAVMDGAWSWEELRDAVVGTLDDARRRAIEPDHIAASAYGWLLPATYAAYTFPEISISNCLLRNVDVFKWMPK